jgi:hypothetical protein
MPNQELEFGWKYFTKTLKFVTFPGMENCSGHEAGVYREGKTANIFYQWVSGRAEGNQDEVFTGQSHNFSNCSQVLNFTRSTSSRLFSFSPHPDTLLC